MSDRSRWIALYVLCAGMLMIVLDITVVNVALPSIKDDLGFYQSSLAWVVNAYLITFGGLLLLAGRLGDLLGRRTIFLWGLAVFVGASILCGASQSESMLIGARLLQGIGGAMTSAVILGMIVTMFPEPVRSGEGGRRLRVRRLGGRRGRPPDRRRNHPADQLALDLLRQRPDRARHGDLGPAPARERQGHRLPRGSGPARRRADHRITDARRLHDRRAGRQGWLGRRHDARPGRRLAHPAWSLHRTRGEREDPADSAADLPLSERQRREPGPGPDRGRDVRNVLHGLPLPAAGAGL